MMTFVMNDEHDYKQNYKQNDDLNDGRFWILKIQFIDPVRKTFYILLERRTYTEVNYITDNIRDAFISKGVAGKSLLSEITKREFEEWYSVAYPEAAISVFKETHYLGDMVQRLLEKKTKLGIEKTDTVHIYHSVDGVVTAYFKSIKSDETEKETTSDKVSPTLFKIKIRMHVLKQLQSDRNNMESDVIKYQNTLEELKFNIDELDEDISYSQTRVDALCRQAKEEGYTDQFIERFLNDLWYEQ